MEVPPLTGWGQRSETRVHLCTRTRTRHVLSLAPSEVSDEDVGGVAAGDEEALCCHRVPSPRAGCDVSRPPPGPGDKRSVVPEGSVASLLPPALTADGSIDPRKAGLPARSETTR